MTSPSITIFLMKNRCNYRSILVIALNENKVIIITIYLKIKVTMFQGQIIQILQACAKLFAGVEWILHRFLSRDAGDRFIMYSCINSLKLKDVEWTFSQPSSSINAISFKPDSGGHFMTMGLPHY